MTSRHSVVACKAIPSRPATIVAVSYDVNNQLRSSIIAGSSSRYAATSPDLPDEGIYIIYQTRALQIAAPPCDKRKCSTSHLCRCDTPQFAAKSARLGRRASGFKKRGIAWPVWKPCQDCLFNWLRLYPAAEAANRLDMQCLQHPRTLTWSSVDGNYAFFYDAELEEQAIRSTKNGGGRNDGVGRSNDRKAYCSRRLFEWMNGAWTAFAESGCCKPGSITAVSDYEDETGGNGNGDRRNSLGTDSEWDDMDIPCAPRNTSTNCEGDDYDFIDDLIDAEFPKLRETSPPKDSINSSSETKPCPQTNSNYFDGEEDDGTSAPAIIPPKNMAVGQGLHISTPTTASPIPWTPVYPCGNKPYQPVELAGLKRSYLDLLEMANDDVTPSEDAARAKQRKRDSTFVFRTGAVQNTRRRGLSQLGPIARRVALA
ncbi:uncharacterized protein F4822DRAFT_363378 [Hypoxylon trugodes]|uniref:uncharacterized protein n=1 Tax=Hypoxylon trugodes TaxID=326681 RepID=UPI00218EAF77|nr:uncharacterized protein F4822DRAFT_363378 [Hypoxylon trugodes]KAI1384425.1 hypothetical protein F4822DRAFT_363378 [Hypoxylon trugodes]